jgi:hypothetical protein
MRTTLLLNTALGMLISIVIASCQGEKGDPGPAGPRGEKGPQGEQGVAGQNGIGAVSYKFIVPVQGFRNIIFSPGANVFRYTFPLPSNAITQDIATNGAVLAYVKFGTVMLPLPYTTNTAPYITYTFEMTGTQLSAIVFTPFSFFEGAGLEYRIVIVPAAAKNGRKANVDYGNYESVKAYFNLSD